MGADLISHFAALGSKCVELDASERLRILHDFYRQGEEAEFSFDLAAKAKRGHDFKDYICPDSMEKNSDYLKLGDKFCRVLFLKDYASYIKDNMVTELTDFNRNLMFSIDVVPVPPTRPCGRWRTVCWGWKPTSPTGSVARTLTTTFPQ